MMDKHNGGLESFVYLDLRGLHEGVKDHVEIPGDTEDFSVGADTGLTVAAAIKPHTLLFYTTEDTNGDDPKKRYVHWLGKGDAHKQEWTFRIYAANSTPELQSRISFYTFNPAGGFGIGSYFRDSIEVPDEWIHVVGVVDVENKATRIYKNGVLRDVDNYDGATGPLYQGTFEGINVHTMTTMAPDGTHVPVVISPAHGDAPLRMGTRDQNSLFEGGLRGVRVWKRTLTSAEVASLHGGDIPTAGLVAEYLLNSDTGSVAVDSVGERDGEIVGASWGR